MRPILTEMRVRLMSLLVLLAIPLLAVGCSGGDDGGGVDIAPASSASATSTVQATGVATPRATATPSATVSASATATATLVASACPIAAEACSFINRMAQSVIAGNSQAVVSSSKSTFYTCPGPNGQPGGPFPLCDGARTGEVRAGFALRRIGGDAGAVSETDIVRLVAEWSARTEPGLSDEYGDGDAHAFTVACPGIQPNEARTCRERFSLVFSGLSPASSAGQAPLRTMLVVDVQRDGDDYRAVGFATGVLDTGLKLALRGGSGAASSQSVPTVLVGGPAGWSLVTFFPWDASALQR